MYPLSKFVKKFHPTVAGENEPQRMFKDYKPATIPNIEDVFVEAVVWAILMGMAGAVVAGIAGGDMPYWGGVSATVGLTGVFAMQYL